MDAFRYQQLDEPEVENLLIDSAEPATCIKTQDWKRQEIGGGKCWVQYLIAYEPNLIIAHYENRIY